jgi:hypothetical protein
MQAGVAAPRGGGMAQRIGPSMRGLRGCIDLGMTAPPPFYARAVAVTQRDIWFDLDGPTPLGRYLYHYTSSETAFIILSGMTIRMGPYSQTNDPREAREWFPSMSLQAGGNLDNDEWWQLCNEVDRAMRSRVHLSCFTEDYDSGDPLGAVWHFHRGWARARMWQQYAENHAGLCLILDRQKWIDQVETVCHTSNAAIEWAGGNDRWISAHGRVIYEDRPVGADAKTLHFSVEELRRVGATAAADERVRTFFDELYLRKNTDWQSEREFRSLVFGAKEPVIVPLRTALVGIVVGEHAGTALFDAATSAMASLGRADVVGRCRWRLGAPQVTPS